MKLTGKARKMIALTLSAALVLGGTAMSGNSVAAAKKKSPSLKLNKKSARINVGKKVTLKVKKKNVKSAKVTWKSSKKSVATVSKKGVVKAKKAGKAKISAVIKYKVKGSKKTKKKTLKCTVTVVKKTTPVTSKKPSASKTPGTNPTKAPTPGTDPTKAPTPGTDPTKAPTPGTDPTKAPTPGTDPTPNPIVCEKSGEATLKESTNSPGTADACFLSMDAAKDLVGLTVTDAIQVTITPKDGQDSKAWMVQVQGANKSWGGWKGPTSAAGVMTITTTVQDVLSANDIADVSGLQCINVDLLDAPIGAEFSYKVVVKHATTEPTPTPGAPTTAPTTAPTAAPTTGPTAAPTVAPTTAPVPKATVSITLSDGAAVSGATVAIKKGSEDAIELTESKTTAGTYEAEVEYDASQAAEYTVTVTSEGHKALADAKTITIGTDGTVSGDTAITLEKKIELVMTKYVDNDNMGTVTFKVGGKAETITSYTVTF